MDCGFCKQQEIQSCLIRRPLHHFMAYVYIYCDVEYIYKLFCLLSASALHNVRDQFLCTQPNDYVFVVNGTYDKHTLVEQRNNIVYFAFMPGNVYWNAKGRQDHIRLSLSLCVQCAPFMNGLWCCAPATHRLFICKTYYVATHHIILHVLCMRLFHFCVCVWAPHTLYNSRKL